MQLFNPDDVSKPLDQIPLGRGILPPKPGQSILEWIDFVEKNYGAQFVGIEDSQGTLHDIENVRRVEDARIRLEAMGERPTANLPARLTNLKETDGALAAFNQIEAERRIAEAIAHTQAELETENARAAQREKEALQ